MSIESLGNTETKATWVKRLTAPFHTMVVQGLDIVASILASILVGRYLGPEGMGVFMLAFTIAGLLGIVVLFGADDVIIRMFSTGKDPRRVFGAALTLLGCGNVACLFLGAGICLLMRLSLSEILVVAMAICTLFFNGLSAIFAYAIVAFDKSRYDIAPMLIARSVHIVGLIVSFQVGGLYSVMATFILSAFLLTSMRAYVVNRRCFSIRPHHDWDYVRVIWKSGWKIGVGAVFGVISARSDVLLLKVITNNEVVGIYGAAYRIVNGAITGISAMASALFPRVAQAVAEGKQTLEVKLFFIIPAVIAVFALFGAAFASEFLIDLLYGKAFVAAYSVLQVLFVVMALETLIAFYNRYLVATHREALLPFAQGVGAFLNVGLNLLLIPSHGAWGAAIATVGSCSATLVCYLVVSQRNRSKKKKKNRTAD